MSYRCGFKLYQPDDFIPTVPLASARKDGLSVLAELSMLPLETAFPIKEAIPSWNADCPRGSGLEIELRARLAAPSDGEFGEAWTPWYRLGLWSEETEGPLARGSVPGQDDEAAKVATDTLVLKTEATALQARIRLLALPGSPAQPSPRLRNFSLAYSSERTAALAGPSEPGLRGSLIEGVPSFSQMIYPDGGSVWCSPTALSMVLGYWEGKAGRSLADSSPAAAMPEARIRRTVAGVYDPVYDGHGNWAFNAAYAGSLGYEAYVGRFASLAALEPWIEAGIPIVMSISWDEEKGRPLAGAPIKKSRGHLSLLRGFDDGGNPAMHEPAAPSDADVPRVYSRAELEVRWLEASGGTVYLVFPAGWSHPALER